MGVGVVVRPREQNFAGSYGTEDKIECFRRTVGDDKIFRCRTGVFGRQRIPEGRLSLNQPVPEVVTNIKSFDYLIRRRKIRLTRAEADDTVTLLSDKTDGLERSSLVVFC